MSRRARTCFARVARRAQRKDSTETTVATRARALGATVEPGECWDLWLHLPRAAQPVIAIEVKDGALCPSKRRLTPREVGFGARWPGPGAIVGSGDELARAVSLALAGELEPCGVAVARYRDATEPGWRERELVGR